MINHPIPAAPWQLGRSLELILLPLVPEITVDKDGWKRWDSPIYSTTLVWGSTETPFSYQGNYAQLKWQVGDRIYLQEPWTWVEGYEHPEHEGWVQEIPISQSDFTQYFTQSTTPEAEHIGWQPAHTMPEAAATHWYAIVEVRVCQCSSINPADYVNAGLVNMDKITHPLDLAEECRAAASRWDAAHPEYPWASDLWVVAVAVEAIAL